MRPGALSSVPAWIGAGLLTLTLSGCDSVGSPLDALSEKLPSPDEFQVIARKPLRMPPSLALAEPRLGERSPLEPTPNQDAIEALLGPAATQTRPAPNTPGESALLAAANASAADSEIRELIEIERIEGEQSGEYEPPTLVELLSGIDTEDQRDAINPAAEARRLQIEGIAAAPIDPTDLPPQEVADAREDDDLRQLEYITRDGKPNNQLPSARSQPAFE